MKIILFFIAVLIIFVSCNNKPIIIGDSNIFGSLYYQSPINESGFKLNLIPKTFTPIGGIYLKYISQSMNVNPIKGYIIYDDSLSSVCVVGFNCSISSPNNNSVVVGTIFKNGNRIDISSREDEDSYNKSISISSMGIVYLKAGDTVSLRVQMPTGEKYCSIKNLNLTLYKLK